MDRLSQLKLDKGEKPTRDGSLPGKGSWLRSSKNSKVLRTPGFRFIKVPKRMTFGSGLCGDLPRRQVETHESIGLMRRVKPMHDVNGLGSGLTPVKVVFAWPH